MNTVSDGYSVQNLSIAVLVNRARLAADPDGATPEAIDKPSLPRSSSSSRPPPDTAADRGDQIKVVAVDFAPASEELTPVPPVGMTELVVRQLGTFVNAATILFVALLLIWFGLRPATRALLTRPTPPAPAVVAAPADR